MTHPANPLREAEDYFHAQIPLTKTMGVRVMTAGPGGFAVEAPVALNSNHLQTAFGGSINAVATLAGYGLLWLALREENAHVVIRESSIRFFFPVRETISALCSPPRPEVMGEFIETLRAKGKAGMDLCVQVQESGKLAAEWKGTFIALKSSTANADIASTAVETPASTAMERTRGE